MNHTNAEILLSDNPAPASRQPAKNFIHPVTMVWMVFILLLVATSCSPPKTILLETGVFEPSDIDSHTFYDQYAAGNYKLHSLSGRANVQLSEPGKTERLIVGFKADRRESLLTLRNNLGIEGGRIYSDSDSVIIYNRMEEIAHKMSHEDASWFYLNGIAALNLLQILNPITHPDIIQRIHENEEFFLVESIRGDRHYFEKNNMVLRRTDLEVSHPEAYRTYQFDNYTEIGGFQLPRRIRILSYDEKSNIFLVIRALDVNPAHLEYDPEIPDNIEIIRI